jgi:hypothetical protein
MMNGDTAFAVIIIAFLLYKAFCKYVDSRK